MNASVGTALPFPLRSLEVPFPLRSLEVSSWQLGLRVPPFQQHAAVSRGEWAARLALGGLHLIRSDEAGAGDLFIRDLSSSVRVYDLETTQLVSDAPTVKVRLEVAVRDLEGSVAHQLRNSSNNDGGGSNGVIILSLTALAWEMGPLLRTLHDMGTPFGLPEWVRSGLGGGVNWPLIAWSKLYAKLSPATGRSLTHSALFGFMTLVTIASGVFSASSAVRNIYFSLPQYHSAFDRAVGSLVQLLGPPIASALDRILSSVYVLQMGIWPLLHSSLRILQPLAGAMAPMYAALAPLIYALGPYLAHASALLTSLAMAFQPLATLGYSLWLAALSLARQAVGPLRLLLLSVTSLLMPCVSVICTFVASAAGHTSNLWSAVSAMWTTCGAALVTGCTQCQALALLLCSTLAKPVSFLGNAAYMAVTGTSTLQKGLVAGHSGFEKLAALSEHKKKKLGGSGGTPPAATAAAAHSNNGLAQPHTNSTDDYSSGVFNSQQAVGRRRLFASPPPAAETATNVDGHGASGPNQPESYRGSSRRKASLALGAELRPRRQHTA